MATGTMMNRLDVVYTNVITPEYTIAGKSAAPINAGPLIKPNGDYVFLGVAGWWLDGDGKNDMVLGRILAPLAGNIWITLYNNASESKKVYITLKFSWGRVT